MVAFAARTPDLVWWPSDLNPAHLRSIAAWCAAAGASNIRAPLRIDLSEPGWCAELRDGRGPAALAAVFCANVVHIAPWSVAEGLIAGAARYLQPGGHLFIYGPFKRGGRHTADSNAAFDASLRATDPDWGVRDVEEMALLAEAAGLALTQTIEMPANNLILVFSRGA